MMRRIIYFFMVAFMFTGSCFACFCGDENLFWYDVKFNKNSGTIFWGRDKNGEDVERTPLINSLELPKSYQREGTCTACKQAISEECPGAGLTCCDQGKLMHAGCLLVQIVKSPTYSLQRALACKHCRVRLPAEYEGIRDKLQRFFQRSRRCSRVGCCAAITGAFVVTVLLSLIPFFQYM